MTLQKFIAKLNWRQILIHFVAFWFFIQAFHMLSYLYDIKFLETVVQDNKHDTIKAINDNGFSAGDVTNFLLWTGVSGFVGLMAAFSISLTISIRRHWFWVNSLLVLILAYTLYKLDFLGWPYLKGIFLIPGQFFNTTVLRILIDGFFLLLIGILLFFWKAPKRFIEKNKLVTA